MDEHKRRKSIKESDSVQLFITEFMTEEEKPSEIKLELVNDDKEKKIKLEPIDREKNANQL